MPAERKPMRYAHPEGYTGVCFDETGRYIVTGGSDGDVRIWESLDDDDPKSINVGDKVYSLALRNGMLVTTVSNNIVQVNSFPDGSPDGILTRFTAEANHVVFNNNATSVAAGSSDFMVKIIDVKDNSQQKTIRGHDGPILSVAFDPKDVYLASSSCDGLVCIWKITDQTLASSWPLLTKFNEVNRATSICRLEWQPKSGKFLAVPVEKVVKLYERESWENVANLSDDSITMPLNVVSWSPCGDYVAAGSIDGSMAVWNVQTKKCVERLRHEKAYRICAMAWHPLKGNLAYTDFEGNLGMFEGIWADASSKGLTSHSTAATVDGLFDEDSGDLTTKETYLSQSSPIRHPLADDDDEDDNVIGIVNRSQYHRAIEDDNSHDIGSPNHLDKVADDDDDHASIAQAAPVSVGYTGPLPTPKQKPFQPCSTPSHLSHRFMVWNSIGIIRCYSDDQDNAIDVEFHDTSIHHAIHLSNFLNHTMADLSHEAVLLACAKSDEHPSTLQCIHFNSRDTNKEWMVDLADNENIEAICLGQGWAAVSTSALIVRIFSIGGIQKELFSLPGPVVSMSGHGEQLMISYHRGTGFDGDQCLGVQLMELGKRKSQVLHGVPLPLSRKSYLTWQGFSAEGTPAFADSDGIVRMLNRSLGKTWIPISNTRDHCKSKSDHYWVIGIHENPQQLRCIPCKGAKFPPTLPRPTVTVLPLKLPYCQTTSEKGQMEEQYWRSVLFHNHFDYLEANNYEFDLAAENQAVKEQQELLMKMFALSCKVDREFRCEELSEFMTQNVLNLAIKYASRSKRLTLAQHLSDLAQEKAATLTAVQEEDTELNTGYSRSVTGYNSPRMQPSAQSCIQNAGGGNEEGVQNDAEEDGVSGLEPEERLHESRRLYPFSKDPDSPEKITTKSALTSNILTRGNPFKVTSGGITPGLPGAQTRNTSILDSMVKTNKRSTSNNSQSTNKEKSTVLKPLMSKLKAKQTQATLFQTTTPKSSSTITEDKPIEAKPVQTANPESKVTNDKKPKKTGFQLWLEESRDNIIAESPDLTEEEIIKEGMNRFRILSAEERKAWTERAKSATNTIPDTEVKKRKRPEEKGVDELEDRKENSEESEASAKKKKQEYPTVNSRLSAFAFKKD
ncbi:WD repeat and HMG-box DNA-binding protein 1 isoform X2 [Hypanus sabinus]|uniref:WD repeat and HMG-box DNA-binding protein 1 isoform X2 n=1 Tax=Hypanus sabinus TaxID=79690 RepID=UPI0028C3CE94|nr:WD repeat and HMG-box DNA-binding protein 1 isoform X2 [Hypanus sabinus]